MAYADHIHQMQDQDEDTRLQCRHILPSGHRCQCPSLREEPFCYFHHTTRRPVQDPTARRRRRCTFTLPQPADLADRSGLQLAIGQVLHQIASNRIDPKRAGLLLYGLQIAAGTLQKQPDPLTPDLTVDQVTLDPELGPLAPPQDLVVGKPRSRATQRLLEAMAAI